MATVVYMGKGDEFPKSCTRGAEYDPNTLYKFARELIKIKKKQNKTVACFC